MGGGSQTQQQTSTVNLSPEQQSLINQGMPFANKFAAQGGVTLPGEAPIAGFTPGQITGQGMATAAGTGVQQKLTNQAADTSNFLESGAAFNPATNPGLAGAIKGATQPIMENLTQQILPQIGASAVGAGGYGGSREGVAEGIASRGAEEATGQATSNIENANYQNALDQMTKALMFSPQTVAEQTIPAQTVSGVGDVQQAMDQALKSYGFSSDIFAQENPLTVAQDLMGLSAGIPGGSVTTQGTVNNQMSPLQEAMGGASIGSALFGGQNGIFPGGLSTIGSGIGSALSGLGSSLSSILAGGGAAGGSSLASFLPFLAAA